MVRKFAEKGMSLGDALLWFVAVMSSMIYTFGFSWGFANVSTQSRLLAAFILKPLPALSCFKLLVPINSKPENYIASGLLFSALGDVLLDLSELMEDHSVALFLAGLGAFLCTQVFYILGHSFSHPAGTLNKAVLLIVSASLIGVLIFLAPYTLWNPEWAFISPFLALYGLVFGIMWYYALARAPHYPHPAAYNSIAVGATLFAMSDAILACGKFIPPARDSQGIVYIWWLPKFFVMLTYYPAQLYISSGYFRVLADSTEGSITPTEKEEAKEKKIQ